MNSSEFNKILFVLNPISGDISKEEVQDLIDNYCRELNLEHSYYFTTGENDAEQLKGIINPDIYHLVVAIGGDGTVSLVANVLNHGDIPLAIIPLGSGNGLSKDLGIPQDLESSIHLMQTGIIRPIDSLDINGHTVFHLSDLGFNAHIVKLFCEGDVRGPGAYAWIALQQYLTYTPFEYKIVTDNDTFEGPAFMLTIANANAFGSNAAINPDGVVDDGFFEICLIEPFPKTAALGILYSLYTDNINTSVYSRIMKCRAATIYKTPEDVVQIDGEFVQVGDVLQINLHKRSLKVLVPAPTEE